MDVDPRFQRATAESTHRSWFMPLVVILLLVLASIWLASREDAGDAPTPTTVTTVIN